MAKYSYLDLNGLKKFWGRTKDFILGKVSSERERAEIKEEEISQNLSQSVQELRASDSQINQSLQAEISSRVEEDKNLNTKINEESLIRKQADDTLKEYIDSRVIAVYRYKGSVLHFEDLPTEGMEVGDVYDVVNACEVKGKKYKKGTNFAWTGTEWDALGSTVDLSDYYTKKETNEIIQIESSRAKEVENELHDRVSENSEKIVNLENELSSGIERLDNKIDESFTKLENGLEEERTRSLEADSELDSRVSALEHGGVGKIEDVLVDNVTVVGEDKIARISTSNLVKKEEKGAKDGVATLNSLGKVPASQLPDIESSSIKKYPTKEDLPDVGEVGILYIVEDTNEFFKWNDNLKQYTSIGGGLDPEFENKIREHIWNKSNPHEVNKAQVGLDKVDNTSDLDKPLSSAAVLEFAKKVNVADVIDNLTSPESTKPLSANQGLVIQGEIDVIDNKIAALGGVLHFRGTVVSVRALEDIENPKQGDVYQIQPLLDNGENGEAGDMYAYTGESWVLITGGVTDISSMVATTTEVYDLIDNYNS